LICVIYSADGDLCLDWEYFYFKEFTLVDAPVALNWTLGDARPTARKPFLGPPSD